MTKLLSLLKETRESCAAFGRRLKTPRPGTTVWRWATGKQLPRPSDAAEIIAAIDAVPETQGRLALSDIYGVAPVADTAAADSQEAA